MQALKRVDLVRQACVLAAGAALALAVLHQGQALPALGLAAAAVGSRALLGQLRLGFFTASKPPGSPMARGSAPTPLWSGSSDHPVVSVIGGPKVLIWAVSGAVAAQLQLCARQ